MKDRKKYFLKNAVVLMIVSAMVLSAIPAVTAVSNDQNKVGGTPFKSAAPSGLYNKYDTCRPLPRQTPAMDGGTPTNWISYNDGYTENSLGLTSGGDITMAIELTDTELAAYRAYDIQELYCSIGGDAQGTAYACNYQVWIETALPAYADVYTGGVNIVATGTTTTTSVWQTLDIPIPEYAIPDTGSVFIGINFMGTTAGQYPCGIDESQSGPTRGALVTYNGYGVWGDLFAIGFPGVWGLDVGVCAGEEPVGECLPDQCDFQLVSINNIMPGPINSLPQVINITIRNNGEVGIPELKLLADVYEKVCGPTTEICCDNVYDLCDWETQAAADWSWNDDGDGDTFVLQGGPGNRWLTNDQAWRCTAGEDRSYGGDEDVYLGLSPGAVGYDTLTWHCADSNDISGAACATFKFSNWCQGEYFLDEDGNVIPVDYGTIAYSLDNGATWADIPIGDFVAYDTEDAWQEVTLKFINTAMPESYAEVCDDCVPAEGDIVINEAFPTTAKLQVKFVWHKDVCDQYEGWYIDAACLTRTEMYELILVHQTHDIIELPPCVGAPVNIYYEFPLGFDPEPDTWYQICILGQVFNYSDCEQIFDNNMKCVQFYVTDIHDMACDGIKIDDPKSFYNEGDSVTVNMTVKNMGTFAENNVPVDLKLGKRILDRTEDEFENNPMGRWDGVTFVGFDTENYWRWTQGDNTINNVGGRSVLPGDEAMICADTGFTYPTLPEGAGCGIMDPKEYDLADVPSATLNFYARWSIPGPQDCDGDGYIDSYFGIFTTPLEGPEKNYFSGIGYYGFENEWQFFSIDLKAEAEGWAYTEAGVTKIPKITYAFVCFMCAEDGVIVPVGNPIPWSGAMVDNVQVDVISCGTTKVVDTQYTGSLAPGQTENIFLTWDSAEYCNWCLCGDIQLPGDVDPTNDVCCVQDGIAVRESLPLEDFNAIDLTGGDECLWHICTTRSCDGTACAWAGIEEEHHGHYVNDMDDSLISPVINLEDYTALGVSLNITTWYQFADEGDFGEVYIRNSSTNAWVKLDGKIKDNSSGFFTVLSYYIEPKHCTKTVQIRFRMVSDSSGYGEGWYICNVDLVEVLAVGQPPAPGDTWYGFDAYSSGASSDHSVWFDSTIPGTLHIIGTNGASDFWSGGTWVVDTWYVTIYGTGQLYTVDTDTGAMTLIGSSGIGWQGLAYDDDSGKMYATNAYSLYEVNMATGAGTLIGAHTLSSLMIDIAFGNGVLYGHDIGNDAIYTINTATGACTLLGSTGIACNYAQGMEYDKNNNKLYLAAYTTSGALYEVNLLNGYCTLIGGFQSGAEIDAFAIPYAGGGDQPIAWGDTVWSDDFDRLTIAPWICQSTQAGNYWDTKTQCISGYPLYGKGLNNAMYTKLDFKTNPDLTFVELYFTTEWDIEAGCHAYIEISPDWDGASPMEDATWVPFWEEQGASAQALISSKDLIPDDRFVLNEYLGEVVYLRFRYTTPGEGANKISDGFWCVHDKQIIYKTETITIIDTEPPVTNIYFDCITGKVTLVATDYPLIKGSGVKATYYKIDGGSWNTYIGVPFAIPEGTHTVYYYSEDNAGNKEVTKSKTYTVDTTPPTVTLISPKEGWLYLFGSPIMNRILSDKTLCIGKVPIEATATDTGSGVFKVLFAFNGKTSWDDVAPYTAVFKGMHFGDLTITVTALDKVGLESAPAEITVKVYSLGLF